MAVLLMSFVAAWTVLLFAPETPVARLLHRALVAMPAERLSRIRGGHILLAVLLAGVIATIWWLLDRDGIAMLSMGAPEITAFVSSIEVSTYLDVLAALIVSASSLRLRGLRGAAGRTIARLRPRRPRRPRTRRTDGKPATNDDEDGPARSFAIAA